MAPVKFFRQRRHAVPVIGGALLTLCLVAAGSSVSLAEIDWAGRSPSARITTARVAGSRFLNQDPGYSRGPLASRFGTILSGMTWLVAEHRVAALPIAVPDLGRLRAGSGQPTVTWIGHSTVLVQLDGVSFLTQRT